MLELDNSLPDKLFLSTTDPIQSHHLVNSKELLTVSLMLFSSEPKQMTLVPDHTSDYQSMRNSILAQEINLPLVCRTLLHALFMTQVASQSTSVHVSHSLTEI